MFDGVAAKLDSQSEYPDIDQYFDEKYDENDKPELEEIVNSAVENGPMANDCRLIFNIPVRYTEKHLDRTLSLYLDQSALNEGTDFEVVVMINSPRVDDKTGANITDLDLKNSEAYQDAIKFQQAHDKPKLTILTHRYPNERVNISRIRKHLIGFTMKRAIASNHPDIANLLVVTNDADMQELNTKYVEKAVKMFEEDSGLDGFGGVYDYPYEEFAENHLLFAAIRFDDILERAKYLSLYDRSPKKYPHYAPMKGGNSIFRVRGYLQEGGHGDVLKNEHGNMRSAFFQRDAFRSKGNIFRIVTSARRYIRAISEGLSIDERLENFAQNGDLADKYDSIPEEQFRFDLEDPWNKKYPEGILGVINKSYFSRLRKAGADEKAEIQKEIVKAAGVLGLEIEFKKNESPASSLHEEYISLKEEGFPPTREALISHLEELYAESGKQSTKYRTAQIAKMKHAAVTLGFKINFFDILTEKNGLEYSSVLETDALKSSLENQGLSYLPAKHMKITLPLNNDYRIIDYLDQFLTGVYRRYAERSSGEMEAHKARMLRAARFMGLQISFHAEKQKNGITYQTEQSYDDIKQENVAKIRERKYLRIRIDDYSGFRDYVINKFRSN